MSKLWVFKMLYLASGSPRRIELLKWTGLDFKTIGHTVDESKVKAKNGEDLVAELAMLKAGNPRHSPGKLGKEFSTNDIHHSTIGKGQKKNREKQLIIGSDLTVELEGRQIGKPKDKKQAKKMLRDLSGKKHSVWTGIAIVDSQSGEGRLSVCETKIKMKDYDDKVIDEYVKEFKVLDKGGAYSIRYLLKGYGSLVEKFEGSFTNVLGFPLEYLENLLKEFKVKPIKDWRKKCKLETGYES